MSKAARYMVTIKLECSTQKTRFWTQTMELILLIGRSEHFTVNTHVHIFNNSIFLSLSFLFTTLFRSIRSVSIAPLMHTAPFNSQNSVTNKIRNFSNIKCQTDVYAYTPIVSDAKRIFRNFHWNCNALFARLSKFNFEELPSCDYFMRSSQTFKRYCWFIFPIILSYFAGDFVT